MSSSPMIITLGSGVCVAGMEWEDFPEKSKSIFRRNGFLKHRTSETKSDHWAISYKLKKPLPSTDGKRASPSRYALASKLQTDGKKKLCSAALLFSIFSEKASAEHPDSAIFIVVANIKNDEHDNLYWTCAIDQNGVIQYDFLSKSEQSIVGQATSFITFKSHLFFLECSEASRVKFSALLAQNGESTITTSVIEPDVWERFSLKSSERSVAQLHDANRQSTATRPIAAVAGGSLLIASSYIAAGYWSQMDAIDKLEQYSAAGMDSSLKLYSASKKTKDGTEIWNPTTFQMSVQLQFNEFEKTVPSSPKSAIETLFVLSERIPLYLNEFKFSKLVYTDGYVFAYFSREPKSSTVTYFLDKSIDELNQYLGLQLLPVDLSKLPGKLKINDLREEGNIRIYATKVTHDREPTVKIGQIVDNYKTRYDSLVSLSNDIKGKRSDLDSLLAKYQQLSWTDIVVHRTPQELLRKYSAGKSDVLKLEKKLKQDSSELENITIPDIEPRKLIGQVMDFVTMMQLDDKFTWSYPTLLNTFPDKKSIEENLKGLKGKDKPGKGKVDKPKKTSKKDLFSPEPVLESHLVEITSNKEKDVESNLKITSFGNLDLLQLKELINKPFIHILDIQYDMESGEWAVKIAFMRKRPAFTTMMQGSAK